VGKPCIFVIGTGGLYLKTQTVKYLIDVRLEWPDLDPKSASSSEGELSAPQTQTFRADLSDYYRVIPNDWPYSGVSQPQPPLQYMTVE